jgi:hypothetical protein
MDLKNCSIFPKMEKTLITSSIHEMAMNSEPVIIVAVLVLAIILIYSSSYTSNLSALPPEAGWQGSDTCAAPTTNPETGESKLSCCWKEIERGPYPKIGTREVRYCQTCSTQGSGAQTTGYDCKGKVVQSMMASLPPDMPTLETVPPNRTLPGGDIPTLETGPGFNQQPEGEPPLPVICSEEAGLELDEETGQCVPIEPEAPEQPEEAEEPPEEEQPSEGEDSSNN